MKHHSILSWSRATLSSFRNLTKYSCISPMAINARKLFREYSKINNHMNLTGRQLRSLQRWSKVNSLMTQEENNHHRTKDQRFTEPNSWRGLPEEASAHSSISPVRSPRLQPFVLKDLTRGAFFSPSHLRASLGLSSMSLCSLPLSPLKNIPWLWAPQLYSSDRWKES